MTEDAPRITIQGPKFRFHEEVSGEDFDVGRIVAYRVEDVRLSEELIYTVEVKYRIADGPIFTRHYDLRESQIRRREQ